VHCVRRQTGTTDWPALLDLHRALHTIAPSLGGAVAFAVATAEVEGPAAGLARLNELLGAAGAQARRFQPARAARALLLERLGHPRRPPPRARARSPSPTTPPSANTSSTAGGAG
jgi:RNA polymerase sigma-70 factor (ECF subfamily)